MTLFREDESVEDFKSKANGLSAELKRIASLTAKMPKKNFGNQHIPNHLALNGNGVIFCRSSKPCSEKFVKKARSENGNRYRVCCLGDSCSQQTRERKDALVQVVQVAPGRSIFL